MLRKISPPGKWHHSPFMGCPFGEDLEPQENTHSWELLRQSPGSEQLHMGKKWQRQWVTDKATNLLQITSSNYLICFNLILCGKLKGCFLLYKCDSLMKLVKRRHFWGSCQCWCLPHISQESKLLKKRCFRCGLLACEIPKEYLGTHLVQALLL